jgi:molecular chaperone HscC
MSKVEGAHIGIDLGTTFSLAAVMKGGSPVLLPNGLGEVLTPSAVSVTDDGRVLVGAPARARATTHPQQTALAFKRDMGTSKTLTLGAKTFMPQELSALVLSTLRADAEAALGCPVTEAVVTVPAYFGDQQRQATRDAAAIAGLHVERIINEPTAAALAYGLHQKDRDLRAIVLDLGGGTFDVTVVEIVDGVIEIQATAGDARLGGDDFDGALADHFAQRILREHRVDLNDEAKAKARLREASELVKKRLSDLDKASLPLLGLPRSGGGTFDVELELSRDEAEEVWRALLDKMRVPIRRAMSDAGLLPGAVDEVLLVGGSSRMPCVARLASQLFGRLPLRSLPPDEAIALGAAVQAALKKGDEAVSDMVVTDVAPFTLGIATVTDFGAERVEGIFSPIIDRGTVIPVSRVNRFSTVQDGQTQLRVEVYQGEHSLCSNNRKLGDYLIKGIPPKAAGEVPIEVRFTYDMNGILEVETTVTDTGKKETLLIESSPGRLSMEEVKRARESMAKLKFHPRDALPNTTALARADALYVELSGPARERLGQAIAAFRAALASQDGKAIDSMRDALTALTASLRRS